MDSVDARRENSPGERWNLEPYESHQFPGKYIIFNHHNYYGSLGLHDRNGTEKDVERLQETFRYLTFTEADDTQQDLPLVKLQSKLKQVSQDNYEDYGCLIIVVLTHGDQLVLYAQDAEYNIDELWKPFVENSNSTLVGKPKIILIQACQGEKADKGYALGSKGYIEDDDVQTIPTFADFLIIQSCPTGYVSFRSEESGSWLIQSFCDTVEKFAGEMDFESILTLMKYDVAYNKTAKTNDKSDYDNTKQIPMITSTLTKKFNLMEIDVSNAKTNVLTRKNAVRYSTDNAEKKRISVQQLTHLERSSSSPKRSSKLQSPSSRWYDSSHSLMLIIILILCITLLSAFWIGSSTISDITVHCELPSSQASYTSDACEKN